MVRGVADASVGRADGSDRTDVDLGRGQDLVHVRRDHAGFEQRARRRRAVGSAIATRLVAAE